MNSQWTDKNRKGLNQCSQSQWHLKDGTLSLPTDCEVQETMVWHFNYIVGIAILIKISKTEDVTDKIM